MAKIKHNNFIDTVDEVFSSAKEQGVLHLYSEDKILTGRTLQIKGREMFHFGTTGYLGLEQDNRLKIAAITAISNYGTQFPLSKSYISHPLYHQLETKLEAMYGVPVIITKNSTLGHMGVIPCAVRDEDGVILDHQVHWSVQSACQLLKLRGIPVEMIRHSRLDMLEDKIKELSTRCTKIWYMADGVYSMFGDYAPVQDLLQLAKKYPQLHLYFDDVHGMSWKGKNGTGYVMSELNQLPDNVILVGTLSKTFGASGSIVVCGNKKLRDKIKTFGGPLTFSAQLEPASVAAAAASADIHLSPEITALQQDHALKISYFNRLIAETDLPMIAPNSSPVFFLGTAMPLTAYNLVNRMFDEGYFINPAIYPAVPVKNTGIRITLSRHNQEYEIKGLVDAFEYHYPRALEETGNTQHKVLRAFGIQDKAPLEKPAVIPSAFHLQYETSISKINKETWNELLGKQGVFDWDGMQYLEQTFTNSLKKARIKTPTGMEYLEQTFINSGTLEEDWDFHYYIIRDSEGIPVVATFFTFGLWKDDMMASPSISLQLEQKRKNDPLYLTSKVLGMGSLFTEGNHCYIDREHPYWKEAVLLLIEQSENLYRELDADMLVLRDFEEDAELNTIANNHGFIKVDMPEACIIEDNSWKDVAEFASRLSVRSRRHLYEEILPFEKAFTVVIKDQLTDSELTRSHELYINVKNNNYAVNTFAYTEHVFRSMSENPLWEFILLYLDEKSDGAEVPSQKLVGVLFCYKNMEHTYVPSLIGMDYDYARQFQLYRQLLFQAIKRAKDLGYTKIDFGITAAFEKRKLGATIIPKVAYVQAKDNFSMEFLQTLQNEAK